ncbi:MAG: DinB family protein [Anaerolineales bacterium]|jgi:hypothetical protein
MDLEVIADQMANQAGTIHSLTLGVSDEQMCWKPDLQTWSILEVINHLYDEECLDFRTRLDIMLHHPEQPWPQINPTSWVSEHRYNERELVPSVEDFLKERRKSLRWLRGLESPDWDASATTPFGKMRAGDMLCAWAAHDLLHLRQLVELHWGYTVQSAQPYQVSYAGEW